MVFHTRSCILSVLGMFHILLSIPMALWINLVILGVDVINFLQFLSIFIILGIGADDVFIDLQLGLEQDAIGFNFGEISQRLSKRDLLASSFRT